MNKADALKQLGAVARQLAQVTEAFNTVENPIPRNEIMNPRRPVVQKGEQGSQNPPQPTLFEEYSYKEVDFIDHLNDMYYDGMVSPVGELLKALGETLISIEAEGDPNLGVHPTEAATGLAGGIRVAGTEYFRMISEGGDEVTLSASSDSELLAAFAELMSKIAGDL